ncbi:MAG: transposase [bacterium]|nr:transposase [bacterium]
MGQRTISFAPNEWYHCYNRGVDKRVVFTNPEDYERFVMLLYACNSREPIHISNINQGKTLVELVAAVERKEKLVDIGAYCLMPNHHHLFLREHNYGGITSFMRQLGTGYTMYFNIKYERNGALFQGTFKAKRIESDQNLNRVVSYIHANPAELIEPKWKQCSIQNEKNLRKFLSEYQYSSFLDYSGTRPESSIINKEPVLEILDASQTIDQLIEEAKIYARQDDNELLPR